MSDLGVTGVAHILVERLGEKAGRMASERVAEQFRRGNLAGALEWVQILRAIREIEFHVPQKPNWPTSSANESPPIKPFRC
jgi:hypothetical protein